MAYEKTNWEGRVVERPRTFNMQQNDDGTVTLIPAEGKVYKEGTEFIPENMNKIEDGLVGVENKIEENTMLMKNLQDNQDNLDKNIGIVTSENNIKYKAIIGEAEYKKMAEYCIQLSPVDIKVDNYVYVLWRGNSDHDSFIQKYDKETLSIVATMKFENDDSAMCFQEYEGDIYACVGRNRYDNYAIYKFDKSFTQKTKVMEYTQKIYKFAMGGNSIYTVNLDEDKYFCTKYDINGNKLVTSRGISCRPKNLIAINEGIYLTHYDSITGKMNMDKYNKSNLGLLASTEVVGEISSLKYYNNYIYTTVIKDGNAKLCKYTTTLQKVSEIDLGEGRYDTTCVLCKMKDDLVVVTSNLSLKIDLETFQKTYSSPILATKACYDEGRDILFTIVNGSKGYVYAKREMNQLFGFKKIEEE